MIGAVWREPERPRLRAAGTIPAAPRTGTDSASQNQAAKSRCRRFRSAPLAAVRTCAFRFSSGIVRSNSNVDVLRWSRSPGDRMPVDVELVAAMPVTERVPSAAIGRAGGLAARIPRGRTTAETPPREPAARLVRRLAFATVPVAARGRSCGGDPTTTGAASVAGPLAAGAGAVTARGEAAAGGGAGAGGAGGAGLGATGGAVKAGRNRSGSTYPFGSSERRTPRWTYGTSCSTSPLGPIVPTVSPSVTFAPRPTLVKPRWVSVTE